MTKTRLDGLYLLLIGTILFLVLGISLERGSAHPMQDFKVLYNPARCLLRQMDPYDESEVLRIYRGNAGSSTRDTPAVQQIVTRYIYPPTAFILSVPFAFLTWQSASTCWAALTLGTIVVASFFAWDLGSEYAPILSSIMVSFLLANCESIAISGNAAGIAVSLCVIAVWCFIRERYSLSGILCLAIGLAIKPHDTGPIWLFFLLAGGMYRKRALQTLAVLVALSTPQILWVQHVSPHWMQEMTTNLSSFSGHGGLNDPSPAAAVVNGPGMLTNLQAIFSIYKDDSRFYNFATYAVCAPLLLLWASITLGIRQTRSSVWLALASIVTLSLLPIYHREYDAKLLLLTVPACSMLWARGGFIRWFALLVNGAGIFINGDIPQAMFLSLLKSLRKGEVLDTALAAIQAFPTPFILLVMTLFYLWIYLRHVTRKTETAGLPPAARS